MTITELQTNESVRQREFPVSRERIFLAHAGVAPLPRRVAEAVGNYATQCTLGDQEAVLPANTLHQARELAASFLGAQSEEIAFVGPTSLALSFVAEGLSTHPGDNIVCYADDYPSNVYPWAALAARGVEVRRITVRELGRITPEDVLANVDKRTRLVALASCHFISGWRIDYEAIGASLREREILFCLDAIQTVGAFPTLAKHVDFLAADAHKWMLGPCAAGILYVRKPIQPLLRPVVHGWNNVRCPNFVAQETIEFRPDARRYEAGTHNLLGLVGLVAALELLREIGPDAIAADLLRKRARLIPSLQEKGYTVVGSDAPLNRSSGIVSFFDPKNDAAPLHAKLLAANVVTSLRSDRTKRNHIRLSPHFYNTEAEFDALLALL